MASKIIACTCTHAVQDQLYGKGKRLHNEAKDSATGTRHRCTVCEHVVDGGKKK